MLNIELKEREGNKEFWVFFLVEMEFFGVFFVHQGPQKQAFLPFLSYISPDRQDGAQVSCIKMTA